MSDRLQRLGRAPFLVSVVVLLANDHVLKGLWPGWWTGKLSDLAGVFVVASLVAVLAGDRVAAFGTAGAFLALKTVPGVAEVVAPILGGVTRRDPSDLLALAVLVPMLARTRRAATAAPRLDAAPGQRRPAGRGRRLAGAIGAVAPLGGLLLAVGGIMATSCGADPAVVQVLPRSGGVVGRVHENYQQRWVASTDGVQWRATGVPTGLPIDATPTRPPTYGPKRSCDGASCYRIRSLAIERQADGGAWTSEFRLSAARFERISTGCDDQHQGVLDSIAVIPGTDGRRAVASLGAAGVVTRSPSGVWSVQGAGGADALAPVPFIRRHYVAVVSVGAALALLVLQGISRPGAARRVVMVALMGAGWFSLAGVLPVFTTTGNEPGMPLVNVVLWSLPFVLAGLLVARLPRRSASADPVADPGLMMDPAWNPVPPSAPPYPPPPPPPPPPVSNAG